MFRRTAEFVERRSAVPAIIYTHRSSPPLLLPPGFVGKTSSESQLLVDFRGILSYLTGIVFLNSVNIIPPIYTIIV